MANDLTITNQRSSLLNAPREVATLTDRLSSVVVERPGSFNVYDLPASVAPTSDMRQILAVRQDDLAGGLMPAEPEAIRRYYGALKAALPSRAVDEGGAATELRLAVEALKSFPEWAIADVSRRFLNGRLGTGRFAPSAAEIAQECRKLILPALTEREQLRRILSANVVPDGPETEEAVKRVMAVVAETTEILKAGHDTRFPGREPDPFIPPEERAARALEAAQAAGDEFRANPVGLSPAMRVKLEAEGHIVQREDAA